MRRRWRRKGWYGSKEEEEEEKMCGNWLRHLQATRSNTIIKEMAQQGSQPAAVRYWFFR